MKPAELRTMNDDQLDGVLKELHEEWQNLRFQEAVGRLTATSRIRQICKDIAREHPIRPERVIDEAVRQSQPAGA